jgi:fumarate reductase flavoprotein subunit
VSSNKTPQANTLEADLVVIGGGGAGLAAAVTAAEKGANVIVLEKRGSTGGNSALATGMFAAESPVQKRLGIEASRDDLFKIAMDYAHWRLDGRIVRTFIDKSADTIRWFEEKGISFDVVHYIGNHIVFHLPKGRCRDATDVLAKNCKDLGVRMLRRTPAKKILTGKASNVTGVVAEMKGQEFLIKTRSVFVGTGGYGGNKELLKKYCPDYRDNMRSSGALPHQGDGLLMAMEVGAATEGLGHLQWNGPEVHFFLVGEIDDPQLGIQSKRFRSLSEPDTLWVNKNGKRFTNEALSNNRFQAANPLLRQPDGICYTIFDAVICQEMAEEGLGEDTSRQREMSATRQVKLPRLDKKLEAQERKGHVKISDSWEVIAGWIGADPQMLKATIDEYNAACDSGHDPLFAKDNEYLVPLRTAPYYAVRSFVGYVDTIGGIKINERMEVIDTQGKPIPGLYAGGVDTGGWEPETYNALLTGNTVGFAFNSGRIAGENIVKFIFG